MNITRFTQFCGTMALAATVAAARPAGAQVVRGTVTDRTSTPAAGAVITLTRAATDDSVAGTDVRSVLADVRGLYSIVAPGPGRYRIIVRRIGSRPYRSEALTLASGEVTRLDIQLEELLPGAVASMLPEIRVTRATPCRNSTADAPRIATLWNDARTALLAAGAPVNDDGVPTLLIRFVRELDPLSLSVATEALQVFDHRDVGNRRGFRSLSGDSLSRIGYWHRVSSATTTFHGPDAEALLSEAFVRDHCFNLVETTTESPDAVALLFEPIPERTRAGMPPDIRGGIWFDAASSRLQRVEFNWLSLPGNAPTRNLGGELNFIWAPSGSVQVDRWHLRMPQDVLELQGSGNNVTGVRRLRIVEEGGMVFADSAAIGAGTASLVGQVRVEGRRPLGGAQVRILGTALATTTDAEGRFAFRQVPAGLRVLVADHPSTATFGLRASVLRVLLDAGETREVSLRAPGQGEIATQLCGATALAGGHAVLRVTAVDSATTRPLFGLRLRLMSRGGATPFESEAETDASGAALFCGLPPNQALIVAVAGGEVLLSEFSLTRAQLASRQLWVQKR